MILTDKFLQDVALAYGDQDKFEQVNFLAYSDQNTTESGTQTSLANEIGDRTDVTVSARNADININSVRTTSSVIDTANGDTIESVGHYIEETGGDIRSVADISSVNHTTEFDLEVSLTINVTRA